MKNKGFTLIELLIVVAIIAVLAAAVIIVVSPGTRLQDAREATRESHMGSIANAIYMAVVDCEEADVADCGTVATVVSKCVSAGEFTPAGADCTITIAAPKDPLSGDDYYVVYDTTSGRLRIWADSSESEWVCGTWATDTCTGTTYKVY